MIEKEKKKRERVRDWEEREARGKKKIIFYLSILCYSRLYIPILTIVGCKKFLGFHTRMELIFMSLVCIIAIGGCLHPLMLMLLSIFYHLILQLTQHSSFYFYIQLIKII